MEWLKKRKLEKKKNELRTLMQQYQEKSKQDRNYYLFTSKYAKNFLNAESAESIDFAINLLKTWDNAAQFPYDVGMMLEETIEKGDYVLGIHRTPISIDEIVDNPILQSIFSEGLINDGDISSGRIPNKYENPSNTISPIKHMLHAMIYTKSPYKDSKGGVLVAFPKEYVTEDLELKEGYEDALYNVTNNGSFIKPEFLMGYISNNDNKCEFHLSSEFNREHKNIR
ncbi:MAG: hypothetical protein PHU94_01765 [Bacilli bacterium]|nr:hypothetical protein [Bacilli bacterium]MDD4407278.1 hypothetical protein [Bacilli bacterium]